MNVLFLKFIVWRDISYLIIFCIFNCNYLYKQIKNIKVMDRKVRHYKLNLGLDSVNKSKDESLYIMVKEDKTLWIVKEATEGNPKIILRSVLKELTSREYTESVNTMMNQYIASPVSLETRIENMKE